MFLFDLRNSLIPVSPWRRFQTTAFRSMTKISVQVMAAFTAAGVSLSAHAHSGPPVALIVGSLWGTFAYLVAVLLFVLAAKDGRRLKRLLLCLVCFPVWWFAVEFSVAPFLDYPPGDTVMAVLGPAVVLIFAVRYFTRARRAQRAIS